MSTGLVSCALPVGPRVPVNQATTFSTYEVTSKRASNTWIDTEASRTDGDSLERAMGFEPTTTCLGSKDSTTELRPPREVFQDIT